jgi:hypothetical protein
MHLFAAPQGRSQTSPLIAGVDPRLAEDGMTEADLKEQLNLLLAIKPPEGVYCNSPRRHASINRSLIRHESVILVNVGFFSG